MREREVYYSGMDQNINEVKKAGDNCHSLESDVINAVKVHDTLAHSYLIYFAGLVIGVFLDAIFKIQILSTAPVLVGAGILMLIGTFFIVWAQMTSRKTAPKRNDMNSVSHSDFLKGPYRLTRSPTQVGLTLLLVGFGFFINSLSVVVLILVISVINHFTFVHSQEKRLLEKYGKSYKNYKDKVKL